MSLRDRARLELPSGEAIPVVGTCAIGRAPSNQVVLDDEHVSRHHAVVRSADDSGSWIVDLGSANGTFVNQRRVTTADLHDGDTIRIGTCSLVFRAPARASMPAASLMETVHQILSLRAWLLLVDVEDSTGIGRRLGALDMEIAYNEWLTRCKAVLEASGGIFDKALGDGFFAFWPARERTAADVIRGLLDLKALQSSALLPFRMVLHVGTAFAGAEIASGTYRLFGPDVTFTFRMETLAKGLRTRILLSAEARGELASHVEVKPMGSHQLQGFGGSHEFFEF